jgi:hypothetical protein
MIGAMLLSGRLSPYGGTDYEDDTRTAAGRGDPWEG